jgi:hypothetical protein
MVTKKEKEFYKKLDDLMKKIHVYCESIGNMYYEENTLKEIREVREGDDVVKKELYRVMIKNLNEEVILIRNFAYNLFKDKYGGFEYTSKRRK